MVMLKMYK